MDALSTHQACQIADSKHHTCVTWLLQCEVSHDPAGELQCRILCHRHSTCEACYLYECSCGLETPVDQ